VPPLTERAFAELYANGARPLWTYVYRATGSAADADDIVQDAFTRLLRAEVGDLGAEDQRRYLFRIAGNLIVDNWRRARRERSWMAFARARGTEAASVRPADRVPRPFMTLKPRDRALLWLAYVEEQTHQEIADALGVKARSVKVLLSRARARLRDLLVKGMVL